MQYPESFPRPIAPLELQNGRGKIAKRKTKKLTPRPPKQKCRVVLPKLLSSVDKFHHQTPRGSPRGKSYMVVSQQLSRLHFTDDHNEIERRSPGESGSSSRSSASSCNLEVRGGEKNVVDSPERTGHTRLDIVDNVQQGCTDSKDELCARNIVSVTSASKVTLLEVEGSHALPTDESGKCETMKDYLLDIAASQEDWTLWQKWKAAPPDAFDFNTAEERKAGHVAVNVGALNKQLTLAFNWSHRPPRPIAISGHKTRTFTRKDPLPLSRAMKKGSLKNLKHDVVAQTQLSPKVTGPRYKAASTMNGVSMAHGVYRLCLPFTFG